MPPKKDNKLEPTSASIDDLKKLIIEKHAELTNNLNEKFTSLAVSLRKVESIAVDALNKANENANRLEAMEMSIDESSDTSKLEKKRYRKRSYETKGTDHRSPG